MTEKKILKILNQPMKNIVPNGYMGCLDCHRYFHHQIIYCPSCGKKVIRHKDISLLSFIKKCYDGAGPMNTLYSWLLRNKYNDKGSKHTPNKEGWQIYKYASRELGQAIRKDRIFKETHDGR